MKGAAAKTHVSHQHIGPDKLVRVETWHAWSASRLTPKRDKTNGTRHTFMASFLQMRKLTVWTGLDGTRRFGSDKIDDAKRGKVCPTSTRKPGGPVPTAWVG